MFKASLEFLRKSNMSVNFFEKSRNQFFESANNSQNIESPLADDDQTSNTTSEFKAPIKPVKSIISR